LRCGLPVCHLHFDLPQQRPDLLCLISPLCPDQSSFSGGFSLFPPGTRNPGHVNHPGATNSGSDGPALSTCSHREHRMKCRSTAREGMARFEKQAEWLEREYPSAAASLRGGLAEMFTALDLARWPSRPEPGTGRFAK
jgi:hypothetical protein